MGEISLNIAVFQDHRALMKPNIVTIYCWTSRMSTFWAIFALKTFEKKKEIFTTDIVNPCNLLHFLIFLPRVYHDPLLSDISDRQTDTHTHAQSTVCYVFSLLNGFIQYIHTYQSLNYPLSLFLYLYLTFSQSVVSI